MNVGVILVAAGQGSRLGAGRPKALVPLGGQSLVQRAASTAVRCPGVTEVVVVAPPGHNAEMRDALENVAPSGDAAAQPDTVLQVVEGGAERADSVTAGLRALSADVGIVLIHDAARALTPITVFEDVIGAVRAGHSAVVPVVPVTDTIKEVAAQSGGTSFGAVVRTIDRANLRAAQTPQGFLRETLDHVHTHTARGIDRTTATDDAGMVEVFGGTVFTVAGDHRSLKITTPHDLAVAEVLLAGTP
ncbi:MAG: 2-C-methyl-D-erythritol 4-phosphate cytidylyltransferase [Ornithinimicrobium sp.]